MKTTNPIRIAVVAVAFTGLFFACSKNNSNNSGTAADNSNVSTSSDDQTMVSNESENITNDATISLSSTSGTNGSSARVIRQSGGTTVFSTNQVNGAGITNDSLICDATVVIDTVDNPKTITITYNGTNCWGNRTRTGTVVLSMPQGTYWENPGATVTMNIENLVITRQIDGKSITINGVKSITNVSGGSLLNLPVAGGSITHTVSDSISVTFSDSATRVWQMAKQRIITYNNGFVITSTGTATVGLYQNVAEWGVNRFGVSFVSEITTPKVIQQSCDFRLTSGVNTVFTSDSLNFTITYGLDASGNPTSCPGTGNYYLEVIWTGPGGRTYPILLPY
jgi:hypothetical protein